MLLKVELKALGQQALELEAVLTHSLLLGGTEIPSYFFRVGLKDL